MSTPSHSANVPRERLRQAADAATEVERAPGAHRDVQLAQPLEQLVDLVDAGLEEFLEIPAVPAPVGAGDDGPVGIAATPFVPVALQILEVHGPDVTGARRVRPVLRRAFELPAARYRVSSIRYPPGRRSTRVTALEGSASTMRAAVAGV